MNPTVIRPNCGTEAGYSKHRRMGEEKCQPCKKAHNKKRRRRYDPEKNKIYQQKYRAKPEVKARRKAYHQEYYKPSPEVLEQRLRKKQESMGAKLAASIDYQLYLEDCALFKEEKKEQDRVYQELKGKILATTKPANHLFHQKRKNKKTAAYISNKRAKRRREREEALRIRKEEQERKRLIKKLLRLMKAYAYSQQHGTRVSDYQRCKRLNGEACQPCKDVAAAYSRHKWNTDPRYKAKDKEWKKKHPDKQHSTARKRARKMGLRYEYYTRQQVIDKYGYTCYLCGEETDPTAPNNMSIPGWETYPHVEHVIPLSKGGSDTLDNVRIAHAKCNMAKGTQLLGESSTTAWFGVN